MPALVKTDAFPWSPKHMEFTRLCDRLKSFKNWKGTVAPQPQDLAEAGFFYLGKVIIKFCLIYLCDIKYLLICRQRRCCCMLLV